MSSTVKRVLNTERLLQAVRKEYGRIPCLEDLESFRPLQQNNTQTAKHWHLISATVFSTYLGKEKTNP